MWITLFSLGVTTIDARPEAVVVGGALLALATLLRRGLRQRSQDAEK